jgi:hypothetical protein
MLKLMVLNVIFRYYLPLKLLIPKVGFENRLILSFTGGEWVKNA